MAGAGMRLQELVDVNGHSHETTAAARHYTTGPNCSRNRSKAHRGIKVLGVTIENSGGVHWGCNHCGWTGPKQGAGKSNGGLDPHDDRNFEATYDYIGFQKVRYPKSHNPRFRIRHREGQAWKW